MTAVIGFCREGSVWIGADSASVADPLQTLCVDPKVFVRGEMIFGCSGSPRMKQLLHYVLPIPAHLEEEEVFPYMVGPFMNAVRQCFRDGGFAKRANEVESGGTFLIGYKGRLFTVYPDYQVAEAQSGYAAIGAGDLVGIGALFVMDKTIHPTRLLARVLEACAYHCSGVRPPFVIQSVPSK